MAPKLPDTTTKIPVRDVLARDATTRLTHAQIAAGAREADAAANRFAWPSPPYYEFVDGEAHRPAGECLLSYRDGAKSAGRLLEFYPDDALLKMRPAESAAAIDVGFGSLLGLHLLRPVAVRRQVLPFEGNGEQQVFPASDRQPFSIELADGQNLQGETLGHINALCGMFLFLPEREDAVIRCFVPAEAIRDCLVGKPIGQMLVDQNLASSAEVSAALQRQSDLRSQRLGELLTEHQIVTPEQLAIALERQRAQPVQKLGETLVELGYLSAAELEDALTIKSRNRAIPLGQILLEMGIVDTAVINSVMARKLGIPVVDLRSFPIAPEVLRRIPAAVAYRYRIVPVAESDSALVIAVENPLNMERMEQLRFIAGGKVVPVIAPKEDIRYALRKHYDTSAADTTSLRGARFEGEAGPAPARATDAEIGVEELTTRLAAETSEVELSDQHAAQNDTTLVKLVNKIITDAIEQNTSDIHIETNPGRRTTRIRFRKDGALVTYLELDPRFRRALVSRIKIMCQLDITERRKPQDGKIDFSHFGPGNVELRVATIPTSNGLEDVVMRVLAAATAVPIDQLGFDAPTLAAVKQLISRPHGLFLVCGPTGSGKTTTLHSLLGFLNTSERKIWTAEDPIEIAQPGLRQIQVNHKIGWSFAAAMRSMLRADPDVIMVGEMRDVETTKIAIEASLTGHLLLATLHTNSAAESVTRLLDLGMDPFNFADALLGVLSQRLVRRLCPDCRVAYAPPAAELEDLAAEYRVDAPTETAALVRDWRRQFGDANGAVTLYRARGCARCDQTGYKGRLGLYELLVADARLKRLAQSRAPVAEIRAAAQANGMRTLKQDGIDKVLRGITDMHQVRTA